MKYIPLSSLQNPYPTILNYRAESKSVSIKGFYNENELNIPTYDYSLLGIIPNTKFRFIVQADAGKLFTSDSFYNDLVRAKNNKNPYFINSALNPDIFVKISIPKLRETFNRRVGIETQYGVSVIFNNLFDANGSVNYQRFGQYIDWVVSTPTLDDIVDNGILSSNKISAFNISEFTPPDLPDVDVPDTTSPSGGSSGGGSSTSGGGSSTGGGGSSTIDVPDTNDLFDPTQGPGINFEDDRVDIPDKIIIDGKEFDITPLPNDIVGGGPVGGEGGQGNLPPGGNQGNRNPFINPGGNPQEDIANEYTVRYRNTNREL